jgi:hypothetical protein
MSIFCIIQDTRPPHIPDIFITSCPLRCLMHDRPIIPHYHIPWSIPLAAPKVLWLRSMLNQLCNKSEPLLIGPSNDFVCVRGDVHCFAARGVILDEGMK